MEEIKLDVQMRKEIGTRKIKSIRREDKVPAIVYGGDREPVTIEIDRRSYERIKRLSKGESIVFHLTVMEGDKKIRDYSAIVKEEQYHPVSDKLIHIDFKRISLKEEFEVKVAIVSVGEPIGVKRDGGSLDCTLRELEVVCLPTNIPKKIEVDVSNLAIGDIIHVKDIVLPDNVRTKHDLDAMVFSVVPSMREEVEAEENQEVEETKEEKSE